MTSRVVLKQAKRRGMSAAGNPFFLPSTTIVDAIIVKNADDVGYFVLFSCLDKEHNRSRVHVARLRVHLAPITCKR